MASFTAPRAYVACILPPGDSAQLDMDALGDNNDTAMAAFMNYLEAEAGLGDPGDFGDIQWTL